MHEVVNMAYRILRHMFRHVEVSKDLIIKLIDSMDADGNGRLSLDEIAVALKLLWKQAMGKIKKPKKPKIRTVD